MDDKKIIKGKFGKEKHTLYCCDCKYYECKKISADSEFDYTICHHEHNVEIDLVNGKPVPKDCYDERDNNEYVNTCGEDAKFFEPKP